MSKKINNEPDFERLARLVTTLSRGRLRKLRKYIQEKQGEAND